MLRSSKMSLSFKFLHQTPARTYILTHHTHLSFVTRNILAIITNYEASYAITSIHLIPSIFPFAPHCVQPSLTVMSEAMQCSPWAYPEGLQWETNYSYTHSLTHTRGQWVVSFGCRSPYSRLKKIPLHPLNRNWVGPEQFWIFLEKIKLYYSSRESNPGSSSQRPSHNTDYSIPGFHTHVQKASKIADLCSKWIFYF